MGRDRDRHDFSSLQRRLAQTLIVQDHPIGSALKSQGTDAYRESEAGFTQDV